MQPIAQILSKQEVKTLDFVQVIDKPSDIDLSLPLLVIGWKTVKSEFQDKININKKEITKNVFWTFDKFEKRAEYERDILLFEKVILKHLLKSVKYATFNVLASTISKKKSFINFIKSSNKKYVYVVNDFIYIYYNETIVGISLNDFVYLGIDKNKILKMIGNNHNNIIIKNDYFLSKKMKKFIGNNIYLIPYLYYLSEN